MSQRIAVIGSNMVDLVTTVDRMPRLGETLAAPAFAIGPGGKGANQAAAAAKLGADVLMVSRVGDDLFGADVLRNFSTLGIDARHVRAVPGTSNGVAPIFVDANGDNSILIVKGANDHLLPADIDEAAPDLLGCDLILLQLEIPLDTVYHAIDWAHAHNKPVLLNPAPATANLSLDRIATVDFFMPNQTELSILTGMPADTPTEAAAAAHHLLARGMGRIVVTLGAEGALLVTPTETWHVPSVRVRVRDTSGAGDAFIGAFAAHYVRHKDMHAALSQASLYAAHSVTRPGTQTAFASRDEFTAFCLEQAPPKSAH